MNEWISDPANQKLVGFLILIGVPLIGGAFIWAFNKIWGFYKSTKWKYDSLRNLNLLDFKEVQVLDQKTGVRYKKEKLNPPSIYWRKFGKELVFINYKKSLALKDFVNLKANLEHLFLKNGESFIEVYTEDRFLGFLQKKIVFKKNQITEKEIKYIEPKNLEFFTTRLGFEGSGNHKKAEIDFKLSPALKLLAPTGSGKTNLLLSIILDLYSHAKSEKLRMFYISEKPESEKAFIELFPNATFINGFDLEEILNLLLRLEEEVKRSKETLVSSNITVDHFIKSPIDLEYKPTVLVIDDAPVFLKPDSYVDKERKELAKKICIKIADISNHFRSCGLAMILTQQSPLETELEVGRNWQKVFSKPNNLRTAETINPDLLNPVLNLKGTFYFENRASFFKGYRVEVDKILQQKKGKNESSSDH